MIVVTVTTQSESERDLGKGGRFFDPAELEALKRESQMPEGWRKWGKALLAGQPCCCWKLLGLLLPQPTASASGFHFLRVEAESQRPAAGLDRTSEIGTIC